MSIAPRYRWLQVRLNRLSPQERAALSRHIGISMRQLDRIRGGHHQPRIDTVIAIDEGIANYGTVMRTSAKRT